MRRSRILKWAWSFLFLPRTVLWNGGKNPIINAHKSHLPHMKAVRARGHAHSRRREQNEVASKKTHDREGLTIFSFSIGASCAARSPFFRNELLFSSHSGVGHHLLVIRHVPLHLMLSTYVHFYIPRITRKKTAWHPLHLRKELKVLRQYHYFRMFCYLSSAQVPGVRATGWRATVLKN